MVKVAPPGLKLNPQNFHNLEYAVYCQNPLTETRVNEPHRIRIIEFLSNGLVLQLPKNICSEGHPLILSVLPRPTRKNLPELIKSQDASDLMQITSKVKGMEREDAQGDRATVEFYQFDQAAWAQFLKSYEDRQKKLDQIIKSMQGGE